MTLGERIRTLREERGWSQTDLAIRIGGSSAGHVSHLEKGARGVTIKHLVALANAFNMRVVEILAPVDLGEAVVRDPLPFGD